MKIETPQGHEISKQTDNLKRSALDQRAIDSMIDSQDPGFWYKIKCRFPGWRFIAAIAPLAVFVGAITTSFLHTRLIFWTLSVCIIGCFLCDLISSKKYFSRSIVRGGVIFGLGNCLCYIYFLFYFNSD